MGTLKWVISEGSILYDGGAILGATPNPSVASFTPHGGSFTTGALNQGDPGDLSGGLTDATVELWFAIDGAPAATRAILVGPESSAAARQWGFELNTGRTVRFYVRNTSSSLFSVTSTTALTISTDTT